MGCGRIPVLRFLLQFRTWGSPRSSRTRIFPYLYGWGRTRPACCGTRRRFSALPAFAGGQAHKAAGNKTQRLYGLIFDGRHKFGNAAHDFAVFVIAEPVSLVAGLHLHLGAQSVDLLAGTGKIGDHNGLDHIALKGPKPQPDSNSVASCTVKSMRRSGLSSRRSPMASLNEMRRNGALEAV